MFITAELYLELDYYLRKKEMPKSKLWQKDWANASGLHQEDQAEICLGDKIDDLPCIQQCCSYEGE